MKKVLGIIIVFVLVLGFRFPSFGDDKDKEIGRYQVVAQATNKFPKVFLVDTATGRTWVLGGTTIDDKKRVYTWRPVIFDLIVPKLKDTDVSPKE